MSAAAWACGLATRSGFCIPGGPPPALARVRLLEPAAGPGIVTLPLRWETAAPASGPVRVLNAGLTLTPDGADEALLRLDGVFRLPFTPAGHRPAGAMLAHRAATACAGIMLAAAAEALTCPATARQDETGWAADRDHRQVAVPRPRVPPGHREQVPLSPAGCPPGRNLRLLQQAAR